MAGVTIEEAAAVQRIAARLAELLTNSSIGQVAEAFRLSADGTNKPTRLTSLLVSSSSLTAFQREKLLASLVMEAHRRHTAGKAILTEEDVDALVADARALGLNPGVLASKTWRSGLAPRPSASVEPTQQVGSTRTAAPTRHEQELGELQSLLGPSVDPRRRGRELESLVHRTMGREGLSPEKNIRIPGEEIDVSCTIRDGHYLVQCKWESGPIGFPVVEAFMARVSRKAEGTFGVVLSMSGFVHDINEKASRGARLNCVGITYAGLMAVLEGRSTWTSIIGAARRAASTRSRFLDEGS